MYKTLVTEIDPAGTVMDWFIQEGVINIETKLKMMHHTTSRDRCRAVLDSLLQSSHQSAFIVFKDSLKDDYIWIKERIETEALKAYRQTQKPVTVRPQPPKKPGVKPPTLPRSTPQQTLNTEHDVTPEERIQYLLKQLIIRDGKIEELEKRLKEKDDMLREKDTMFSMNVIPDELNMDMIAGRSHETRHLLIKQVSISATPQEDRLCWEEGNGLKYINFNN